MYKIFLVSLLVTLLLSHADGMDPVEHVEMTTEQRILADEHTQAEQIQINFDHIQTYSAHLKPNFAEEFTIKVAEDHHIKDGVYSETSYVPGEEIYLQIFEDGQRILVQKQCYHVMAFEFYARKGHKYYLKFITTNSQKAIVFALQNFLSEGQVQQVLKAEHAGEHANRTKVIKEHLTGYLSVIERHSLFTDRIAEQVSNQTSKFLAYQWFEMLIVFGAAVAQVYFLRRMLNSNSII